MNEVRKYHAASDGKKPWRIVHRYGSTGGRVVHYGFHREADADALLLRLVTAGATLHQESHA